jgi:hypothetical protein
MPRKREPVERCESLTAHIGRRVAQKRNELGWTQEDLQDRYASALKGMGAREPSADRIKKIELARSSRRRRAGTVGPAKVIAWWELKALGEAMKTPPEWFVPAEMTDNVVFHCDPCAHPEYASGFLAWLRDFGKHAERMIGWAEFLPCSLEPEEFMRRHNEALFIRDGASPEEARSLAEAYNRIGNARRRTVLKRNEQGELERAEGSWEFLHLIYRRDLERIAQGVDEYAHIDLDLRLACLRHLIALLEKSELRISLIVAEAGDVPDALLRRLKTSDSLAVFDDRFVFWRDHAGSIFWSRDAAVIKQRSDWLEEFRTCATHKTPEPVIRLLNQLIKSELNRLQETAKPSGSEATRVASR